MIVIEVTFTPDSSLQSSWEASLKVHSIVVTNASGIATPFVVEVYTLYTTMSNRRKHYATKLLQEVCKQAKVTVCFPLQIGCLKEAIGFWKSFSIQVFSKD